ncbi:MAG TPA: UDP-N-acetylmuramoyl-L-alanine--D-glutamate ligase [Candidatus Binatia bacterium]|nr:UDP-N-acetylmuramoyl-L-alanine--D-glutamate ligase [Candidatus Binatia bacterium]
MDVEGKKVMVLGLARTGIAAARFLAERGADVTVSDRRSEADLAREIAALGDAPIDLRLGGEDSAWLENIDILIPSPGVPQENPLLQAAVRRGMEVVSEIELGYRFIRAPLIAITGTNGKSTTTSLIGAMLKAAGANAFVGGNIGAALIGFAGKDWDWGVVEVSSFQLEWVKDFRPRIAILLNLTEDHLDRYPSFADYGAAKERIFAAQKADDVAILNRDDPLVWRMRRRVRARIVSFGWSPVEQGVYATNYEIVWRGAGAEERFPLARVKIQGVHNVENLMAAIAAAKSVDVSQAAIQGAIESFAGLEHRLEFVREKNGVRYYNDSKGTNVGAVIKSLASFSAPVILLAGGVDKGGDYAPLADEIRRTVKKLILFGAAKEKIRAALGHLTETALVESLDAAVRDAAASARQGDVVLLSPACSSFDMFRDYTERGKTFRSLVQEL